jgi:hypothetical protein
MPDERSTPTKAASGYRLAEAQQLLARAAAQVEEHAVGLGVKAVEDRLA